MKCSVRSAAISKLERSLIIRRSVQPKRIWTYNLETDLCNWLQQEQVIWQSFTDYRYRNLPKDEAAAKEALGNDFLSGMDYRARGRQCRIFTL